MVRQDVLLVVWEARRRSETAYEESFILQPLKRHLQVPEREWRDVLSGALGGQFVR